METFRTEEEQVEALRRWWDENGRSTIGAILLAAGAVFGWQSWQGYEQRQADQASDIYQALITAAPPGALEDEQRVTLESYAEQLKTNFSGTTYAQFAALQVARAAVQSGDLERAEAELRWVLAAAPKGGDVAQITELRLARVLAARGEGEQALQILQSAEQGSYSGAYAAARGDVLLSLGRSDEARAAYSEAQALTLSQGADQFGGGTLTQKLQSLTPVPATEVTAEPETLANVPAPEAAASEGAAVEEVAQDEIEGEG